MYQSANHMPSRELSHRKFAAILAGIAASLISISAHASLLFSTGFESPTYTSGPLAGQDGWLQDIGATSAITVQMGTVKSGTQAVQIDATGQPDYTRAYRFDNYDTALSGNDPIIDLSGSFLLGATGTPSIFRFGGFNGTGNLIGLLQINNTGELSLIGSSQVSTGVLVSTDAWHSFDLTFDFSMSELSLTFDGSAIASGIGFSNTSSSVFLAQSITVVPLSTGTQSMFVDDLSVTTRASVPEPPVLSLLAIGLIGIFGLRLAQATANS
jgi:hypothetical protein